AVMRASVAVALVGLVGFVVVGSLPWAIAGAVLWGAGAALGLPVGMSAAGDEGEHAAARVAVVATLGYTAFIAGPTLLGLLAEQVGYRQALIVVAVPLAIGLLAVGSLRRTPTLER